MNINYNQRRQQLLSDKQGPCAAILFFRSCADALGGTELMNSRSTATSTT